VGKKNGLMSRARVQNTVELAAIGSLLIRNKHDFFCVIVFLAASGKFWESNCLLAGSVMGKHVVLVHQPFISETKLKFCL